jgi:hypothetical protein
MTAQPDPEHGHSRMPFRRRELREAGTATPPAVKRFKDPGAVSSQRAYGRSIYKASQVNVLLARYDRIRGDLLMAWPSVQTKDESVQEAGVVCCELLSEARGQLQKRTVSLTVVAHLLTLADRAMVSIYSDEVMRFRVHTLENRLHRIQPIPDEHIRNLDLAKEGLENGQRDQVETAVKDVLNFIGEQYERRLIEDDLQVSRLSKAIVYVAVGWVLLLAIVPFLASVQKGANGQLIWPLVDLFSADRFNLFLGALGLSIVGAVGGIVSGMFSVRDSVTNLLDYRTSVKRMALKPLFGGVAALTLYFFLSANLISGVAVTSAGTYVVAAFLAGFSERYFLRFVDRGTEALSPPPDRKGDPPQRAGAQLNLVTSE